MRLFIKKMSALRKKIDKIDNQIIKLLRKRSFIIPKVRKAKKGSKYKIAFKREISMATNLQQKDFGLYQNIFMQKIWREIIGATLTIECGFNLMVSKSSVYYHDLWELTKDHFGSGISLGMQEDDKVILDKLVSKEIECAIFPWVETNTTKWWLLLREEKYRGVRINLGLPFFKDLKSLNNQKALVLSLNDKDISGKRGFFIIKENSIPLDANIKENTYEILDKGEGHYLIMGTIETKEFASKFNVQAKDIMLIGSIQDNFIN